MKRGKVQIIAIGCGVNGLSSAIRLLEAGHTVTIWAKDLPPHTTSNVAAAIWYPYQVGPLDRVVGWGQRSYEIFCELAGVPGTGVSLSPGLEYFEEAASDPEWAGYVRRFRHIPASELPFGYAGGLSFDLPLIETPIYMNYLQQRFSELGGKVVRREISALAEALAESEVVINCSGLGARTLLNDREVFPIRGQIIRVSKVSFRDFVFFDTPQTTTYIIPRSQDCILGGTSQPNNWSLEPDMETASAILERCARLRPEVKQARILDHLVGLRPGRSAVRLEAETFPDGVVIHNYGHGGAGITLSWGCAEEVLTLLSSTH